MKEIDLGNGQVAIVDDEDFEFLDQWNWWFHRGTVVRSPKKPEPNRLIRMHYVVLKVEKQTKIIHKNRNQLDCRKENLSFSKRELLRRDREARGAKRRRRNRAVYIP